MITVCNVVIEYFDKRSSQFTHKKSRANASVRCRSISGGFEILVKSSFNNDMFITNKPIIFDKFKSEGKISLKIPEFQCSLLIRDADEIQIGSVIAVLLCQPNIGACKKSSLTKNTNMGLSSKSNLFDSCNVSTPSKSTISKCVFSVIPRLQSLKDSPDKLNSFINKTPIKKRINLRSPNDKQQVGLKSPSTETKNRRKVRSSPSCLQLSPKVRSLTSQSVSRNVETFTTEQQNVISACVRGEHVFFTGGAGTGECDN